jgi:hypothetical protein
VWINLGLNTNWKDFLQPGASAIVTELKGEATTGVLIPSQQKVAAVLPAMIAKYGLEDRGVAIGHSSTASLILRSLLADPRGDLDAAAVITQHLKGVGISGITTRLADERTYTDGGRPPNPWPTTIEHVWLFSGLTYSAVNARPLGGEGPTDTRAMSLNELFHWIASSLGLPVPPDYVPRNDPAGEAIVQFDAVGPGAHVRVLQTPGEGHTTKSQVVDLPANFWETMS